jgi:hypothetical protein
VDHSDELAEPEAGVYLLLTGTAEVIPASDSEEES